MKKSLKKIIFLVVILISTFLLGNQSVNAATSTFDTFKENKFSEFEKQTIQSNYNLYLGERIDICDWSAHYYFDVRYISSNEKVAKTQNEGIVAVGEGKADITVKVSYNGKFVEKKFSVTVNKTKENTKLESKNNDVISQKKNVILVSYQVEF